MDVADLVDKLLVADKELIGSPVFGVGNRSGERRLVWPVLVSGESTNCTLCVTAYPGDHELRFTITLNFRDVNIWRLDHESPLRCEINPFRTGHPYSGERICGPHCHPWSLNRGEATPKTIPDPLPWRAPLPQNVRGWENAFRWFLGETNIAQPGRVPDLPKRESLV